MNNISQTQLALQSAENVSLAGSKSGSMATELNRKVMGDEAKILHESSSQGHTEKTDNKSNQT